MDCHAKWPDTRGQRGSLGGGSREEGGNCRRRGAGGRGEEAGAGWIDRGADRLTSRVCFQVNLFLIIREQSQKQHGGAIIMWTVRSGLHQLSASSGFLK